MTNRTNYDRALMHGASRLTLAVGLTAGLLTLTPMAAYAQYACGDQTAPAGLASGDNTVACGENAVAAGKESVSLGYGAGVNSKDGTEFTDAGAAATTATRTTSIGFGAVSNFANGTAIGALATSNGANSVAFGAGARTGVTVSLDAEGKPDIVGGTGGAPTVTNFGTNALAHGNDAKAIGKNTIAIGQGAEAGLETDSAKQNSIAIGQAAKATGLNTIAIGQGVVSAVDNQVALGGTSATYKLGGLQGGATGKTGAETQTGTKYAVTVDNAGNLGWQALSTGGSITGFGANKGDGTAAADVVIGSFNNAVAAGSGAKVTGNNGIAIGSGAEAAASGIAIGTGVKATANQVAIGTGDAAVNNTMLLGNAKTSYTLDGLKDATRTGSNFVLGVDKDGKLSVVQDQTGPGGSAAGFGANNATGGTAAAVTIGSFKDAVAVGSGATVTGDGGIAIGSGVSAAANQVVIGKAGNTYKFSGLTAAADTGYVLGVDKDGNVTAVLDKTGTGNSIAAFGASNATGGDPASVGITKSGTTNWNNALAAGSGATVKGDDGTALGGGATAAGGGIALGKGSNAGAGGIAIGVGVSAGANQVAISSADATVANTMLLGNAKTSYTLDGLKDATRTGSNFVLGVDKDGKLSVVQDQTGTGGSAAGFGANNATGGTAAAVSIGSFKDAVAVGSGATVTGDGGIAIGSGVTAAANQVVIGKAGNTYKFSGLTAAADTGYVLGVDKNGNVTAVLDKTGTGNSIAAFGASNATGGDPASVGITKSGTTNWNNALAAGSGATVKGDDGIALGSGATAEASGIALGSGATAAAGGFAFGKGSNATAGGIAIGNGVSAAANEIAIGSLSNTYKFLGLSKDLDASKNYYISVDATGKLTAKLLETTTGGGSTKGVAVSGNTPTTANDATAAGKNAAAVGSGAAASKDNSVALGAGSTTGDANVVAETTFAGTKITAPAAATGVVSVGSSTEKRQIQNVAAGKVAPDSTDAVNGGQLYAYADALDKKATAIGAGLVAGLGGGAKVDPDGKVTGPTYNLTGTGTYTDVGEALKGLNNKIGTGSAGIAVGEKPTGSAVASASGTGGIALGYDSKAGGAKSTALGFGSEATHENATAIGTGAKTERANQTVIGKADNTGTTTIKGTTSTASQALVDKSSDYIMMTNANGDVAAYKAADLGFASKSDVDGLRSSVNRAFKKIDENTQGIAVAIAMTGAVSLPVNHNFGIAANWGFYDGKNAFSSSAALRLRENIVASGSVGVALDSGTVGTRLGMQMTW